MVTVTDEQTSADPPTAERGWWQDACRVWREPPQVPVRPADNPSNGS